MFFFKYILIINEKETIFINDKEIRVFKLEYLKSISRILDKYFCLYVFLVKKLFSF